MLHAKLLLCLFSLTILGFKSANHPSEWKFIADKWVAYGADRDVIHMGDANDDFRQIKLKITNAPLKIINLKIYFDNDEVQDVSIRNEFRQGSESRVIDLNGGLRHLKKVEFWYSTIGRAKGKARVALWARK